jgi:hypothetical protein
MWRMDDDVWGHERPMRPPSNFSTLITIGIGITCLGVVMLLFDVMLPFAVLTIVFGIAFALVAGLEFRRDR